MSSWVVQRCFAFHDAIEAEPFGFDFHPRFGNAHSVRDRDWHVRVFLPVLDEHHPATRLERLTDAPEHRLWAMELVIDIDQQRDVDGSRWQASAVFRALHDRHVSKSLLAGFRFDHPQHRRLQIVRVDASRSADEAREPQAHAKRTDEQRSESSTTPNAALRTS